MWFTLAAIALTVVGSLLRPGQKTTDVAGQPQLSASQIAALNNANMRAVQSDTTVEDQLIEQENQAFEFNQGSQDVLLWIGIAIAVLGLMKITKK